MANKFRDLFDRYEREYPNLISPAKVARAASSSALTEAYLSMLRSGKRQLTPEKAALIGQAVASIVGTTHGTRRSIEAEFMLAVPAMLDLKPGEGIVSIGDHVQVLGTDGLNYTVDLDEIKLLAIYRSMPEQGRKMVGEIVEAAGRGINDLQLHDYSINERGDLATLTEGSSTDEHKQNISDSVRRARRQIAEQE